MGGRGKLTVIKCIYFSNREEHPDFRDYRGIAMLKFGVSFVFAQGKLLSLTVTLSKVKGYSKGAVIRIVDYLLLTKRHWFFISNLCFYQAEILLNTDNKN